MGSSEQLNDWFNYSDMPEDLIAFVMICQKRDSQISP
jgi:hypothetical protein